MKRQHHLPSNTYLQSYLEKAGVRFDPNIVDTVCKRRLGKTFYVVLLLLAVIFALELSGNESVISGKYLPLLILFSASYLVLCLGRWCYFSRLRRTLRRDRSPLAVEAYAVVLMDISRIGHFQMAPRRSAILYKEIGTLKPRFYTGALKNTLTPQFNSGQLARVYPDRRNPRWYSVDDESAFQTVSARRKKKGYEKYVVAEFDSFSCDDHRSAAGMQGKSGTSGTSQTSGESAPDQNAA